MAGQKMKCLTCVLNLNMALSNGERMRLRIILTSFLCILIVMPFRVNAFFWDHAWIKEIPPQERGMGALSHSIAIDTADQPHILYVARSKLGELSLRYTVRKGGSWFTDVVDPECGDSTVRIAISASGNLHTCYQGIDLISQQTLLMYATHDTNQWSTHVVGNGGSGCSIALNPEGFPFISHIAENGELKLARYDGTQWITEDEATGANPVEPTSMAIAPSGEVYISFVSATDPPIISWIRNGSGSWKSSFIDNGNQIGMVLDSNDAPRVVYNPDTGASVVYAYFNGSEWIKFKILEHTWVPHTAYLSHHPAIAIDPKDAVHILYGFNYDVFGWTGELNYVKYDGVKWEPYNTVHTNDDGFRFVSSIAINSFGIPCASYNIPQSHTIIRFAYFATPELSGTWLRFTVKNKKGLYSLNGNLKIINSGEGYAGTVQVNFFLSDDMNLSSDDVPLGQVKKLKMVLKAGKRKTLKFSWNTTENLSGKYVLAVIDPDGLNIERNKTDNVVSQLIP